jgi:CheY-like chemotaxis protein
MESQKHILVVDDDKGSRVIMSHVVEMLLKQKATAVSDGIEAISIASKEHFDLVLLDLRLPSVQGLDVVRTLRQGELNKDVPVIAVTAFDLPWFRDEAMRAGCNCYVTKPVDVEKLAELIKQCI